MQLALNMIVKNEAANIGRLLLSVAPHIAAAVIIDTGSTDNTIALIHEFCDEYRIPLELHHTPFINFAQARNFALDRVRESKFDFSHILLTDADMELVTIGDEPFHDYSDYSGLAYFMRQRQGALDYDNVRIIDRKLSCKYVGVTHEYLDLGFQPVTWTGAYWIDHASGGCRPDKFKRDIALLRADLITNRKNPRSWFYLAQSYRDDGQHLAAIDAYTRRNQLGDWFEEVWHSQYEMANCYLRAGKPQRFVEEMLKAVDMRPERAEPLRDLAKFYREKGMNRLSTIFAKAGMILPVPSTAGALFIDRSAYDWGCEYEYSIAGFYDQRERAAAFTACDHTSFNANAPWDVRDQSSRNLFFYTPLLSEVAPSWAAAQIDFTAPDGCYSATNPSVTARGNGQIVAIIRTVNYRITESGHYDMQGDTAIRTRNFLFDFETRQSTEILPPAEWATPIYDQVIGFEDMRLIEHKGELWFNACVRERNAEGWCEQYSGRIDESTGEVDRCSLLARPERLHEKNWAPVIVDGNLRYLYRPSTVVDECGRNVLRHNLGPHTFDEMSESSQLVPYDGGWVAVMHEFSARPDGRRWYRHRFAWFDCDIRLRRLSQPFCFNHKGIEFAVGLARNPNNGRMMISYGVNDREAWIGEISSEEMRALLWINGQV